jgi:hypothetical protein
MHDYAMGRDHADRASPDLFSTDTVRDTSPPPSKPVGKEADTVSAPQRHILPKNLHYAVSQLNNSELDELFEAAFDEAKRRGRLPVSIGTVSAPSSRRPSNPVMKQSPPTDKRRLADIAEVPLTRGQLNAVRSAFKAGITPSRIARQFGISQGNVRKALASDEPRR